MWGSPTRCIAQQQWSCNRAFLRRLWRQRKSAGRYRTTHRTGSSGISSHGEKVNERLFGPKGISANMSDEQKQKKCVCTTKKTFVDYDPREDFSDLIKDCINSDPQQKSIKKAAVSH